MFLEHGGEIDDELVPFSATVVLNQSSILMDDDVTAS